MGISLLRDKLRGLNELKATFALWAAGSSTELNGLIQAIESIQAEYLDEIEKRNNRKAERAAAAAARGTAAAAKEPGKGKKGKDGKTKAKITCGFCGKFAQKTGAHGAPTVEGLTGVAQSNSTVDVEVPHLGRRNALVMDNSVNMACMAEACEDMGFHFYWPAYACKPHFWKDGEPEIPLVVHSRADALYASVAKELGPSMIEKLTPEFLKSLTDEFFQTLFDEFASQTQSGDLASLNGEVYATVTRDEATGYPSVRPLRSETAVETAAAWNDMYGGLNPPVLCCRTDIGSEFDAEFDTQLMQQRFRHECMRSLMLMSGLPYVFWAFCLAAAVYLYARSPTPDGGPSPYEYDISRRQPFGSACFLLEETLLPKFEPRGRLGVDLRYGRSESCVVLDYEHYVQSKGEARIVKARDVRFMPELRFPFPELREQHPDSMHWLARMFELVPHDLGPTADASGKCTLCGLWATNCEVSCKAPPRLDISAPSTPDEQRGLVRERSRQTTPSDAPAHKYVTFPQEERGGVHPHEGEINNLAWNDVLDMASLDEWDAVRAKDPSAEMLSAKMLTRIKDYEELGQSSLDDANWKARLVCTGNFIRNAAGHVAWSVDSMYAAPVDLHNARLVVCFGAKRG
ncbi:unnamed protein product [Symbiodinium microadriaticum]|nr:unnamed protein product [Symbiodinium microadriaticum]